MFSIRIVVGIICSLPRPAYPGPSVRVPGPVSPHIRAHEPGYAGRDREQAISAKDSKEDEMLSKT